MQSLSELNNYSSTPLRYTDERPMSITFSSVVDQSVNLDESESHAMKVGCDITFLQSAPSTLIYVVDLSAAGGKATAVWSTLPTGVSLQMLSANIYRIIGFTSVGQWNQIKSPTILMAQDYVTEYSYTGTIDAGEGNVRSWTTQVTINDSSEVNTFNLGPVTYDEDVAKVIPAASMFQITDLENTTGNYTVVGTMSEDAGTITSSTSIGTMTMTGGVLTITGTKSVVNSFLQTMTFVPKPDYDEDFTIQWTVTSVNSGFVTTLNPQQFLIGVKNEEINNLGLDRSYKTNGVDLLFPDNVPFIGETIPGASYTINLQLSADVGILSSGDSLTTFPYWTAATKTFTYTGTKDQVNSIFTSMRLLAKENVTTNAIVYFTMSRNGLPVAVQQFNLNAISRSNFTGTTTRTIAEEAITWSWGKPTISLHYSKKFCIFLKTYRGAVNVNDVLWFDGNSTGWFDVSSGGYESGSFINFAASTSVSSFETKLNAMSNVLISMRPGYLTAFDLRYTLGIGGEVIGTSISGGTQVTFTENYTVIPYTKYQYNTGSYQEDQPFVVDAKILDPDVPPASYTVTFTQVLPAPNGSLAMPGGFVIDNVYQTPNQPITITGTKAVVNAKTVKFVPPADYNSSIQIRYQQSRTRDTITTSQADQTNSFPGTAASEVTFPATESSRQIGNRWYWGLSTTIGDQDPSSYGPISGLTPRTYTLTVVETTDKGTFYSDNNTSVAGKTQTYTGTNDQIATWKQTRSWMPTTTGQASFTFTLTRHNDSQVLKTETVTLGIVA